MDKATEPSKQDATAPKATPLDYYVRPRRTPREWIELTLMLAVLGGAMLIFFGLFLAR